MDTFDFVKIAIYIFGFVYNYFVLIEPNLILCSMLK